MSVFKIGGRSNRSGSYIVEYTDQRNGQRIRRRMYTSLTDKALAQAVERQVQLLLEYQLAGERPTAAQLDWAASTSEGIQEHLVSA